MCCLRYHVYLISDDAQVKNAISFTNSNTLGTEAEGQVDREKDHRSVVEPDTVENGDPNQVQAFAILEDD